MNSIPVDGGLAGFIFLNFIDSNDFQCLMKQSGFFYNKTEHSFFFTFFGNKYL